MDYHPQNGLAAETNPATAPATPANVWKFLIFSLIGIFMFFIFVLVVGP
ncbi:hypothetical protein M4D70_20485 [Brevibacillus borstelensis]|nr:hypothetical protein [Brevibacillus borstelensis]MCM3624605.1 hypothetical protein [Brevibacillus borstelensis]